MLEPSETGLPNVDGMGIWLLCTVHPMVPFGEVPSDVAAQSPKSMSPPASFSAVPSDSLRGGYDSGAYTGIYAGVDVTVEGTRVYTRVRVGVLE